MHIVLLKNLFSAISSIIIFVICRSAKKYAHGEIHEENAEARSPCLNLNNVWKWEIISTVSIETSSYFGRWNWCVFLFFFWYILFIVSFGCVTTVNREMKSVSAI